MSQLSSLRHFFEKHGFTVSSRLAESLGMSAKSVRLFFIYASFTTIVGGFIIYLTLAFWLKLKDLICTNRTSVFTYELRSFTNFFFIYKYFFLTEMNRRDSHNLLKLFFYVLLRNYISFLDLKICKEMR